MLKPELEEKVIRYVVEPISIVEFLFYLVYWTAITLIGCYNVYYLAYRPETLKFFLKENLVRKTYFGLYQSKHEYLWEETVIMVNEGLKYFLTYVLVSKFLRSKLSPTIFMISCTITSIFFNYYNSSAKFVAFEWMILLIPCVGGFLRSKTLVWIFGLFLLYKMKDYGDYDFFNFDHLFKCAHAYTALLITRAISVGLTIAEAQRYDLKLFLEMNFYYWYFLAIISSRMMSIKDFVAQIYDSYIILNWKRWLCLAFRVIIWYCIWNIVSALVPFYLVFATHDIKSFNIFMVSGGQLFFGIHFYLIYFILYNTVYLITQLDGFLTAEGPECICHIALYSRMWRTFDVGMHLWIKDHIFRPIMKFGHFHVTKVTAVLASFGFVILFHGLQFDTVMWIGLNVVQFFLHSSLVHGFSHCSWGLHMQRIFSPAWNRRFIAFAGAISWLISIYAFGVFSYGFDRNAEMYMTLLRKDSNRFYYRLIMFLGLCYSHAQISLTVNEFLQMRKIQIY